MSVPSTPRPASASRVVIDAPRLWGGGLATACVAALVASVGVFVCRDLLDIKVVEPPLLRITNSFLRTMRLRRSCWLWRRLVLPICCR